MKTLIDKRPWGHFERFSLNEISTVKLLYVNQGKRLSLQYHTKRSEFWKVVLGRIKVTLDERSIIMSQGETLIIPVLSTHRVEAINDSVILEISDGEFDEEDIVRLQDDYNRDNKSSLLQKV